MLGISALFCAICGVVTIGVGFHRRELPDPPRKD